MENQDKIYEQFKEAAGKAEQKGFDRMEAVWSRVEEKLDEKKKRRGIAWWKYTGAAAMLLLFISIGNLIMRNNADPVVNPNVAPERNVTTVIDTQKVNETFNPAPEKVAEGDKKEVVVSGYTSQPVSQDSLSFRTRSKKARVWNSRSDKGEFRVTGDVTYRDGDVNSIESEKSYVSHSPRDLGNEAAESTELEEVVVIGHRVKTKSDVVAVTTIVSAEELSKASVSNMATVTPNASNQYPAATANRYPIDRSIPITGSEANSIVAKQEVTVAEDRANASVLQSLQGQVAGLNIATGKGQPGADTTIVLRGIKSIRGNAEPLYIIDGIPVDAETINNINHNDIENVQVLKDVSATSIYGNRGANGVIVIKTKDGFSNSTEAEVSPQFMEFQPVKPKAKIQVDQEEYESFEENKFENTATVPLSTFSIDVDNASYTNVRRFLNNGQTVPKDAVRVEEMINFFKYQYPQPTGNDVFSINTEYSDAPWNPKHKLLKIGLKGKDIPTADLPASNFVFLIDVSGSMSDSNKLPLLKQSMKLLVNQMRPQDRIAIVVYAGAAGLVLPSTSGGEKSTIINALNKLEAGGSTAGGAGIELAYKTAQENFIRGGNNRVILATDGDFNVGASSDTDMQTLIEEKRKSGVFLTCLGYGMGNYKDSKKMEILADKGNGNYAYIDNMQEADRFLQKEFKGSMFAIAKDVKIQIEFNPKHVQSYRLIGYENRKLRNEDFTNDAIDAGELGSGHTVTALYEIIPLGVESDYFTPAPELKYSESVKTSGNYSDELATIKFRHKKPDEDVSKETVKVIPNVVTSLSTTSGDFKFAAAVAWFGLKLRDSKLVPNKETKAILELAKQGQQPDPEGYRAEFIRLVEMVE